MSKTQINYRIDEELLSAIKKEAKKRSQSHTQWIIEACQEKLGWNPLTLEALTEEQDLQQIALEDLNKRVSIIEEQLKLTPPIKTANENPSHDRELTHAELARQLGVSASTISRWSTGKRKPPEDLKYRFDQTLKLWIKHES